MKIIAKQLFLLITVIVLLTNCVGDKNHDHRIDFLSPIKIEIPDAVKQDAELTALVKESEKAINEFSDNMEYLIEDIKPYQNMKEEDVSTFNKLKLTKIGIEFFANSAKGMSVLEKLDDYTEVRIEQQKPLTDEQIKAMSVIYDTFKLRMQQLEQKYKDFGGKD